MSKLAERFTELIAAKTEQGQRFKFLEGVSAIPAISWRKAFNGGQRPTAEMLETVAQLWPEHVFWLLSGWTDNEAGHSAPDQSGTLDAAFQSRPAAIEFFRLRGELSRLAGNGKRSLKQRWEDWLTDQQERNSAKYRWASVHPALARRKTDNARVAKARDERMHELVELIGLARRKRRAEAQALDGSEEN